MKVKQSLAFLTACILLLVSLVSVRAEADRKKLTLMVYMCGADLESKNGQATRAMRDIRATRYNADEVNVIFLAGGTLYWRTGYDINSLTLIQANGASKVTVLDEWPWTSMGHPDTLSMFLNYCYEQYPAESYDLVLWDHGGGPNGGVCFDEVYEKRNNNHSDGLTIPDLKAALDQSPFADKGLDLILFHACLMGSAEVANALSPYARYMVACEDSQYGLGYSWLSDVENDASPFETAKRVADCSYQNNEEIIAMQQSNLINSFAVIDLEKAAALIEPMDRFFSKVSVETTDINFTAMSRVRRDTVTFGVDDEKRSYFDLIDLGDLVTQYRDYSPEDADVLLSAIDDAVPYKLTANDCCSGLTVYHPFRDKTNSEYFVSSYDSLCFSSQYASYLYRFNQMLLGKPFADYSGMETGRAESDKDNRVLFTLGLNEEQTANYGESRLNVLQKREDGSYLFTYMNPETLLDGKTLTGEFTGTALYVTDAQGEILAGPLAYTQNGDIYYISAILSRKAGEVLEENGEVAYGWTDSESAALIACTYDPIDKTLHPGGIRLYSESLGGYTAAQNISLSDYDEIQLSILSRTEKRGENGVLLSYEEWDAASSPTVWRREINDGWHFQFVNDSLPISSLYAVFEVTDSQNNCYSSELLCLAEERPLDPRPAYDDMGLVVINRFHPEIRNDSIVLSLELKNIRDNEVFLALENVSINGIPMEGNGEAFGKGPNGGLMQGEVQGLMASFDRTPLNGQETVTRITFDIAVYEAASGEKLGTVTVDVPWNGLLQQ